MPIGTIAEMSAEERAILISYRCSDSRDVAGRICDRLQSRFGSDAVFIDDTIPYGVDFPEYLQQVLDGAKVMLGSDGADLAR